MPALRLAWLGNTSEPEGVLIEFFGAHILVGCPSGAVAKLDGLGIECALDAVLVTSGGCLGGWLELWRRASDSPPRLLGTAPVLQAAKAWLSTSTGDSSISPEELRRAFSGAEEVSYGQEMVVEGENGPVFLSAAPSGGSLGGSFWCLEALGVRMAVIGTACAASVPVAQGLDTEALSKAELVVCLCLAHDRDGDIEIRASLPQVSQEASAALGRGGNVLVPIGPDQAFTEDLVMSLARQIAKLSDKCQGPIFACGAPALRLRRCGVFAEFASKTCLDRAHSGEHPFLVDALCESGRLVLAETVSELAELYQEPCMVLASQATAQSFDGRWAKNPESRILRSDAPLAGCQLRCLGQPFRRRLLGSEIRRLTSSRLLVARGAAELLESSSRLKAQSAPLVLPPAEFVNVPLDLSLARVQCWLPEDQMARIEKGKRPADSMLELLEGAFVGRRRPRISGLMPCSTSGAMRREAVRLGLEAKGLEVAGGEGQSGADGQKTELLVPSLNARIILNQPVSDDPNAIESIVECVSVEGRRQILEVLNAELQQ